MKMRSLTRGQAAHTFAFGSSWLLLVWVQRTSSAQVCIRCDGVRPPQEGLACDTLK
jgi:hypothetical protein